MAKKFGQSGFLSSVPFRAAATLTAFLAMSGAESYITDVNARADKKANIESIQKAEQCITQQCHNTRDIVESILHGKHQKIITTPQFSHLKSAKIPAHTLTGESVDLGGVEYKVADITNENIQMLISPDGTVFYAGVDHKNAVDSIEAALLSRNQIEEKLEKKV